MLTTSGADQRRGELSARWRLERSPKYASYGTVRVVSPAVTIKRAMPLMEAIGVTRVADVTGLDRVGIPNFTTVRPRINVRRWLERVSADGAVDGAAARRLLARARHIFYADRSLRRLLLEWEQAAGKAEIQRLLLATGGCITDVKAADAELVLRRAQHADGWDRTEEKSHV